MLTTNNLTATDMLKTLKYSSINIPRNRKYEHHDTHVTFSIVHMAFI